MSKKNKKASFAAEEAERLHKNLDFFSTEQYKLLRTNIMFTLTSDIKCPVIGITSATKGEAKSTTAVNLSYVIAENGSKVLLIDGDLRMPTIAQKMELPSAPGLTDFLVNRDLPIEQWKSSINENWYILPAGHIPPNPSELLSSQRMNKLLTNLKEQFDYIIIDLPPINIVSDALSVSGFIDGMILVARENFVTKRALEQCFKQLRLSKVNLLGCVLTSSTSTMGTYGKYSKSKYKKYGYYRGYEYSQKD